MNLQKIVGLVLLTLGTVALIFAGFTVLRGGGHLFGTGVTPWGALVPFVIGCIFFTSGIRLIRGTP